MNIQKKTATLSLILLAPMTTANLDYSWEEHIFVANSKNQMAIASHGHNTICLTPVESFDSKNLNLYCGFPTLKLSGYDSNFDFGNVELSYYKTQDQFEKDLKLAGYIILS